MLNIRVAKNAGFCFGVKKAVELALSMADGECYMLGNLIHNSVVVDELKKRGLKTVSSIDELPIVSDTEKKPKVIIRSHGAACDEYDRIIDKGYEIIDATCPFVAKIHDIVKTHYEAGEHIVIIGAKSHPEVKATAGWCDNTASVISDETDLDSLNDFDRLCFVCQTTFD